MVQCAAAPDNFWIQHHTGIYHSTNDAAAWEERQGTPSSFGCAVASHPREAGVAWFVPAEKDQCRVPVQGRCGVMRTTDGGKTFELLTEGLPAAPAYHLVYRHGRDVDRTGEVLAMGATTGSLWLGRDGGERWARVSAELPPIITVRFCPERPRALMAWRSTPVRRAGVPQRAEIVLLSDSGYPRCQTI